MVPPSSKEVWDRIYLVFSKQNQNLLGKKWYKFSRVFFNSYQTLTEENNSSVADHYKWIPEVQYLIYQQESLVYIKICCCQSVSNLWFRCHGGLDTVRAYLPTKHLESAYNIVSFAFLSSLEGRRVYKVCVCGGEMICKNRVVSTPEVQECSENNCYYHASIWKLKETETWVRSEVKKLSLRFLDSARDPKRG